MDILLLAAVIAAASAVPFVPTGELVAGYLAWHNASPLTIGLVFIAVWLASSLGDFLLLNEVRLVARPFRGWLERHLAGSRLDGALGWLGRGPVLGMIFARLVPGGRAPMIVALGLAKADRRRFLIGDAIGCALWAALYVGIGTISAQVGDPYLAVVVAVVIVALVSLIGGRLRLRTKARKTDLASVEADLTDCLRSAS